MKRAVRLLLLCLILAFLLCFSSVLALATDTETEGTPEQTPEETPENTTPLYAVVGADGEKTEYCDITEMSAVFKNMNDGDTMQLLSDITDNEGILLFEVPSDKTLNFDFNGHTITNNYKTSNLFFLGGENGTSNSTLNIYSSQKGGAFRSIYNIAADDPETEDKVEYTRAGSPLVTVSGTNNTVNLGKYGDIPGENFSMYGPVLVQLAAKSVGATANIDGGNYYRPLSDWVGFIIVRDGAENAVINLKNSKLLATGGIGNINLLAKGVVMNIDNCFLATVGEGEGGSLFRTLDAGTVVTITDSAFAGYTLNSQTVETLGNAVIEGIENEAQVLFKLGCSFDRTPPSDSKYIKFEKGRLVGSDSILKNESWPIYNENEIDYTLFPYEKTIRAPYVLIGENDETVEIAWDLNGEIIVEEFVKGAVPYPLFNTAGFDGVVDYVIGETEPAYEDSVYDISISRHFNIYVSTVLLGETFDVRVYIPCETWVYNVKLGDAIYNYNSLSAESFPRTQIDGADHYVFEIKNIPYRMAGAAQQLTVIVFEDGKGIPAITYSCNINIAEYCSELMSEAHNEDYNYYGNLIARLVKYHCDILDMEIPEGFLPLIEKTKE